MDVQSVSWSGLVYVVCVCVGMALVQDKENFEKEMAITWPPHQMALVSVVALEGCTCNWYPPNMAIGMQMPNPRLIAKSDLISVLLELTRCP